jgi:4-diphosphocytidyl-2-C-methyl-D-erythritol kinase
LSVILIDSGGGVLYRPLAMNSITLQAPAKINLVLKVLGLRPNKYHDVWMIMERLAIYDEVTVTLRKDQSMVMTCTNPHLPTDERNLCVKAARAMRAAFPQIGGVTIHLDKRVPMAAGMGGGSSDAASVIRALVQLCKIDCTINDLVPIAASLGADIPFFLYDGPAVCEGIGEIVTPLSGGLPTMDLLIVNPGFDVPTKEIYDRFDLELTASGPSASFSPAFDFARGEGPASIHDVVAMIENDLEPVTKSIYGEIIEIEDMLEEHGALKAWMTGSGPTVVGLFADTTAFREAQRHLEEKDYVVFATSNQVPAS